MGFRDFFRKASEVTKRAVDRAAKEAKYRKKALEIKMEISRAERVFREEVKRREMEVKKELLSQLKMKQLEAVCAAKGIPTYRVVIENGEERKVKIRSKSELVDLIASKLSLEDVVDVCRRYKVKSANVVNQFNRWLEEANARLAEFKKQKLEELEEYKRIIFGEDVSEIEGVELEEDIEIFEEGAEEGTSEPDIVDVLMDFEPETVRDEEDLEKQLYQFLRARFGSRVQRQYPIGDQKIDVVIDGRIGIEVKIAESRGKLQRLVGQVLDYIEYLDEVIAVILDVGANVNLDGYTRKLKSLGVEVVVLEGTVKRKGKSREIIIKEGKRRIIIR
ncbi:hypothetical protein PNA2_0680 [Pyrococcus sp. NA2]|uniref:hypothetical protein n=1 Tax=Pyrococcus sp. (strain NA2) TaxID=342949 RepID=UPI000209AD38|nr:hypothetical protein [Pyrococcus sp. NA2]AEC51596.1 hypothetical protein PNA2_0680 [Pyrococcus sp. NA2]